MIALNWHTFKVDNTILCTFSNGKNCSKEGEGAEIHQSDREWGGLFNSIFELDNTDYQFAT